MIRIRINDEVILINKQCSLTELLIQQNYLENNFAVALNRHFVARDHYASTFFKEDDIIELVEAMQGG